MSSIEDEAIHTLPVNDLYDHVESPRCPCKPRVIDDGWLVIHNSFDRRELFEYDHEFTAAERIEKLLIVLNRFCIAGRYLVNQSFLRLFNQLRSR